MQEKATIDESRVTKSLLFTISTNQINRLFFSVLRCISSCFPAHLVLILTIRTVSYGNNKKINIQGIVLP